jgi:hypothetical protein
MQELVNDIQLMCFLKKISSLWSDSLDAILI